MADNTTLTRGEFLKISATSGAGLILGFHLLGRNGLQAAETAGVFEPNVWLSVAPSGDVTIIMHRAEMGQKIWTSLPMIVAEELGADWSKVTVKQGDLNPAYGGQNTGGSASIRTCYDKLRKAGATARAMLISAAAQTWDVPPGSCRAAEGIVTHSATNRTLTYGELAQKAAGLPVPEEVTLKAPKDYTIIGQDLRGKEVPAKVNGSAIFGYDYTMPGMLVAMVARCPVFGGKVASYEEGSAKSVAKVRHVVEISSGVAVVADDTWAAIQGREALKVTWDEGPNADLSSADISKAFAAAAEKPGEVLLEEGDATVALASARKKLEAVYEVPYLDHASMEPMNATAHVHDGMCEVWAPTQFPNDDHEVAMKITGLPAEKVVVHPLFIGGAFGRRADTDFIEDAVEVSKALGVPVKVVWTRDEDVQHGHYRPASYHKMQGGLDKKKRLVAWTHRASGPENGSFAYAAADLAYGIPNIHVDKVTSDIPVPTGYWRSVANTQVAYVNECFMDELAEAAKEDPYEFRRALMKEKSPRLLKTLDLVAEKAGWGKRKRGRYRGIAAHASFNSYAATVVEVSKDRQGPVKIERIVCAMDCGLPINPDGIRNQVEGGSIMALTAAIYGKISLKNGRVEQSNYHNYQLVTMAETPVLEVVVVPSTERPTGVGEPSLPPLVPVVINAIYAATGIRIRRLPISDSEVRLA